MSTLNKTLKTPVSKLATASTTSTVNELNFITFGGPTPNFHTRVNEICTQASLIPGLFTNVTGYTDRDLKTDSTFWEKHGNFIESNPRGYGYWLWKPYLIKKTLDSMNDGDVLIYADAGCYLNLNALSVKRLYEYIEMVKNTPLGLLSFQMEHLPEYKYTKRRTIRDIIGLVANPTTNRIIRTGQCMATVVIMRKTPLSVGFVNEWWRYAENYNIINDLRCELEHPELIDHRHDQSIYSILAKKHGATLIKDETFFYPNWKEEGANYPFWAIRAK